MTSLPDRVAYHLTVALRRVSPGIPVLRQWPGLGKVVTGFYNRIVEPGWVLPLAILKRRRLSATTFVGVTGSVGKTTAKDMIAAILSTGGLCEKTPYTENEHLPLAQTILRTSAKARFCVLEVGAPAPGYLDRSLQIVRPDIGVVTAIGFDHRSAYGGQEAIAREKGKLVESLPPGGTAILNADDPLVIGMRSRWDGRVITYGLSRDAMVRADGIEADWPDRLRFTVHYQGQSCAVRTQLCGSHWVGSVLAGLSAGVAAGIPLRQAADAVASVKPQQGRMSPTFHDDGVVFIRDDWKASYSSFTAAFDFMERARAARKILIIGTISDYAGTSRNKYTEVAKRGREVADHVFFVGRRGTTALRVKRNARDESIQAFASVHQACELLGDFFRDGDLVLLKGSTPADHLHRIILARTRPVSCWLADCGLTTTCDTCPRLESPSGSTTRLEEPVQTIATADGYGRDRTPGQEVDRPAHVIVGIGNPGKEYVNTPHSVGYRVLDRLAGSFGLEWHREENVLVARTEWKTQPVLLVKPLVYVNEIGPALEKLGRCIGFGYAECLLVHDDMDLPLGQVRARLRGGDGGHRGVRSILLSFQTDEIRRVKIGVGRRLADAKDSVLVPFTAEEIPRIEESCQRATDRVMELLRPPSPPAADY